MENENLKLYEYFIKIPLKNRWMIVKFIENKCPIMNYKAFFIIDEENKKNPEKPQKKF